MVRVALPANTPRPVSALSPKVSGMEFSLTPFTEIAPGIHRAVAEPASVNIGLVVGDTGALVVDTGSSPAQGRAIRAAVAHVTDRPIVGAVATHHHYDHLFGLGAFADVVTYGHTSLQASVEANADLDAELARLGVRRDELAFPTRTFNLAATADVGGRHIEIVHFGTAHTPGDAAVLVPDANVIFTGDLFEESGPPSAGPDSDLKGWPRALDGILGTLRAESLLVPGHGEPFDRDFAFTQRGELAGTWAQADYLVQRGVKEEDAYEAGEWNFPEETIRTWLPMIYAALAAEGKRPRTRLPLA